MIFYETHGYDFGKRVGRRAQRKFHDVKICECGAQAWIGLGDRHIAMVDILDKSLLDNFWWGPTKGKTQDYATSPTVDVYLERGRDLHLNIAKPMEGYEIDHIDGNPMNCTRSNLRHATKSQNQQNRKLSPVGPRSLSKFKGVKVDSRENLKNRYCVRIEHNGKSIWLGRFSTEEQAAKEYDLAASEHFGQFARLNFPK